MIRKHPSTLKNDIMKKYVFLFIISLLLVSNKGISQASLGISQTAFIVYNDTVSAFTLDSINIYLVNKGDSIFNGTYKIMTAVQDSNSVVFYHLVDSTSTFFPPSIPAGDSINVSVPSNFIMGDSSTQYHYKINVIVIWPVAANAATEDSLIYDVFILLPKSITEIDLYHLINAYPNPTTDKIILENGSKNSIEEVRIYDSKGGLVESLNKPEFIYTEAWSPGVYLINIQLKNNKTQTIRIVKQ